MKPRDDATEVTAAGIARLAGVGRAAVSNWRRRHGDFPRPVGGTETSPAFALADVERWLRAQGKLIEVPLRERVWQQLAGHPAGPVTALLHAGCALLLVRDRPSAWLAVSAVSDERMAQLLPGELDEVVAMRFGVRRRRAVRVPEPVELQPSVPLLRGVAELAAELGAKQTYEFLLGRHTDANPRQYTLTPAGPAALMAELAQIAAPARTVLDPACGTGALLRAVPPRPDQYLYGQDSAPELAALTALRLALHSDATVRTMAADTLLADAYDDRRADAVLCHPPFNERNWGHDELAYDTRWEYGFPARAESELAWVQHALARLVDGGTAVLLMPPAAASRRSGRRIRADLLRRGALRAVIALPAGAAPPYNLPLHVWVLRRPGPAAPPAPELLLVEAAGVLAADGRDKQLWPAVHDAVLDAWRAFDRHGTAEERPGLARSVPVLELLDDEVDLAPARRLPPPATGGGSTELATVRESLGEALRRAADLTPALAPDEPAGAPHPPSTTIGELARAGALTLHTGTGAGATGVPVLTDHDVLTGGAPSGTAHEGAPDETVVRTEPGDVVVPVSGGGAAARVIDEATAGAALGRGLTLLRPDPAALDPWFVAGFLRGTANHRRASSYASTSARLDVRRLRLPRLPLEGQRGHSERFRELAAFEDALRLAGRLGEQLVRGMHDGLTEGTLPPE
ncbi:SAM-dependent methyltransferase [Streptomyces sp. WAC 01529]|uniref:N-6 DNA methylase n=1 Tax=Streptomyces sp. WAC 01529 TaxID=2203205 RepID=UPI000F71459F|nr:N-6 DNA methylase [Streptomyces sp. WAC 01529]AZM53688.1 SAM-dependent methyltransferase [Streptomyces sp. WAC 01529]